MTTPAPPLSTSPPPPVDRQEQVTLQPLDTSSTPPSHDSRKALLDGLVEKKILTPTGEVTLEYAGYPLPPLTEDECASLKACLFAPIAISLGTHTYTISLAEVMDSFGKRSREEGSLPFTLFPPRIIGEHVSYLLFVETGYAKRVFSELGLAHLIPYLFSYDSPPSSSIQIHTLVKEKEDNVDPKQVPEALYQTLASKANQYFLKEEKEYIPVASLKELAESSPSLICTTSGKVHLVSFQESPTLWILSELPYTPNFSCDDLFLSLEGVIDGGTPFLIPASFQKKPLESFLHLALGWIQHSTFEKRNREAEGVFWKCKGLIQPHPLVVGTPQNEKSLRTWILRNYGDSATEQFAFAWNYCLSFRDKIEQKAIEDLFVSLVAKCRFSEEEQVFESLQIALVVLEIPLAAVADILQIAAFLQYVRQSPSHSSLRVEITNNTILLKVNTQTLHLPLEPYRALERLPQLLPKDGTERRECERRLAGILTLLFPPGGERNIANEALWHAFPFDLTPTPPTTPLFAYLNDLFIFADPSIPVGSKITLAERSLLNVYPLLREMKGGKEQWESFLGVDVLPSFDLQEIPFAKEWIRALFRKGGGSTHSAFFLLDRHFSEDFAFRKELLLEIGSVEQMTLLGHMESRKKLKWPLAWDLFLRIAHKSPLLPCDQVLFSYLEKELHEKYEDRYAPTLFGWLAANPLPEGDEVEAFLFETMRGLVMIGELKNSEKRWANWIYGIVSRQVRHLQIFPPEVWRYVLLQIQQHLPKKLYETYQLLTTELQLDNATLLPLLNRVFEVWINEKNPLLLEYLFDIDRFERLYLNDENFVREDVLEGYSLLMQGAALLARNNPDTPFVATYIYQVATELQDEKEKDAKLTIAYLEIVFASSDPELINSGLLILDGFLTEGHPPEEWMLLGPLINILARPMEPQPLQQLDSLLGILEIVLPTGIQYEKVITFLMRYQTLIRVSHAARLWKAALDGGHSYTQKWWDLGISLFEYLIEREDEIALTNSDLLAVTFNQHFTKFFEVIKAPPLPHFFLLSFQHFGREDNTKVDPLVTNLLSCMGNLNKIYPYDKEKQLLPAIIDYILIVSDHNHEEFLRCLGFLWEVVQCKKGQRRNKNESIFLPIHEYIEHKVMVIEKILTQAAPGHPRPVKLANQANIFLKTLMKDPPFAKNKEKIVTLLRLHQETMKRLNDKT